MNVSILFVYTCNHMLCVLGFVRLRCRNMFEMSKRFESLRVSNESLESLGSFFDAKSTRPLHLQK